MTATNALAREETPQVIAYDFRQPMTLAREHSRVLEMTFETFSRHWSTRMVAHLRANTQVKFVRLTMCTYDEYVASLPALTTLFVFSLEGGRRTGVMEFPLDESLRWIDRVLGGTGKAGAVAARDLSEIEQELIRHLTDPTLHDLVYSFATVYPIEAQFKHLQYSPQMMQAIAASTPVLVARFTIDVEGETCDASVMLPAEDVITSLKEDRSDGGRSAEEIETEIRERERLDRAVEQVPVELVMRLRPQSVRPQEILSLQVGDIFPLIHTVTQPMEIVVGNRILAEAAIGSNGSRVAAIIIEAKENL